MVITQAAGGKSRNNIRSQQVRDLKARIKNKGSQRHKRGPKRPKYQAPYPELKGCTKTTFDPLRAASHQAAKASCARESLPQLIFVALHAANLGQLLKDVPFFFVRKTLLECSLFVADTLDTGGEAWR